MGRLMPTIKSYAYTTIRPLLQAAPPLEVNIPHGKTHNPYIAAICDHMTWQDLSHGHVAVSLTPKRWREVFTKEAKQKVGFLFCEATWSGTTGACWRGKIYKDERVSYENRRDIIKILDKCKTENVPTVFWAKEDPTYFQDPVYNFTDTALKFDYIFTTAKECIPKYQALGHNQVHLLPFGFSPEVYFPPLNLENPREKVSVFAGSWFPDHPKRCDDLTMIFDMVLSAGIPLRIYDRHMQNGHSSKPFPAKYQPYVHNGIPGQALGEIYRNVDYAINVNTVSTSETMFARRVYESMACGCIVISNESIGMRQQFGNNVWFIGNDFDHSRINCIRKENIKTVFANHTWEQRVKYIHELIGVSISNEIAIGAINE